MHVPRDAAVLAYQFGDGFTNMIIPTNAVLVGVLSVSKVDYSTWFKWMIKFQILLFGVGALLLVGGYYMAFANVG